MNHKRAVALIDLLGIKTLTHYKSLDELDKFYQSFIVLADTYLKKLPLNGLSLYPNHPKNQPLCQRHILSDSIVLVAHTDQIEDTLKVIVSAWRILQACMGLKRPVRGAIVYDEILLRPQNNYLIGKALVKAHALEGQQNWMGIIADDTMVEELNKNYPAILDQIFLKYAVPMKMASDERWALNWRFNFVAEKGTKELFAGNPCVDKVNNTLAFAKAVIDSGHVYCSEPKKWPIELQCFFIGAKQPPFGHGE